MAEPTEEPPKAAVNEAELNDAKTIVDLLIETMRRRRTGVADE
jgi:hypothetical protein